MIVPPWLVLFLLVSLTLALLYQIISRRYGWRLLLYWLVTFVAVMGFEALAETAGWEATRFGDIRLAPDVAGGVLVLCVLWFLGI